MKAVDFLDRPIRVGDWVAVADKQGSSGSRQRLALVYEITDKKIKLLRKHYSSVYDGYVLKTDHMAILDKSKLSDVIKKDFIEYYRERYKEGKFIWNESILGSYI